MTGYEKSPDYGSDGGGKWSPRRIWGLVAIVAVLAAIFIFRPF